MKKLLSIAAMAEVATGAALLILPMLVGQLLLGVELSGVATKVARVTGMALIALGIACGPANTARRALYGMLTYSTLVAFYLAYVGIIGAAGILLWPVVAVHAGLSILLIRAWWKDEITSTVKT